MLPLIGFSDDPWEDTMKYRFAALALSTALAAVPFAASAETLIFATTPEQHPLNSGFLVPWAERVEAAANGELDIDVRHGPMIANHMNFYDRVVDDVTQIGWGMTVFNPGKFPHTLVATLPFMVDSAEQGSVALCRMYEAGAFGSDFDGLKPLLFVEFPQASLSTNGGPLTKIEDIAGKKIITSTPAAAAIVSAYGGTPLSFNITEQYEALQRGAADGTMLNFTAFPAFRLNEVTTDHLVLPLGGAMGVVFMAQDKYDGLSDAAKAAIDANSGCDATRGFGAFIDGWEEGARGMVASSGDHTFTEASAEDVAALTEKMGPGIEAGFAQNVPDGANLIAMFKEELAKASQ
jgi:TRAP-type C4-dicarboxylate transport system substrate-binding protein